MSDMEISFDVSGIEEFRRVARVIGRENRNLPQKFLKTIDREAKVLRKEAAAKASSMPVVKGEKHTGLRRDVASGVFIASVVEKDGARGVRIMTSMPDEEEAIIPRGLDSRRGWRHPVFGDKSSWVTQHGAYSWFMETMDNGQLPIALGIHQHIKDAIDAIDDAATG